MSSTGMPGHLSNHPSQAMPNEVAREALFAKMDYVWTQGALEEIIASNVHGDSRKLRGPPERVHQARHP